MTKCEIVKLCQARALYSLRFPGSEVPWWIVDAKEICDRIATGLPWDTLKQSEDKPLFTGNEKPLVAAKKSRKRTSGSEPYAKELNLNVGSTSAVKSTACQNHPDWPATFELSLSVNTSSRKGLFVSGELERPIVTLKTGKKESYIPDAKIWRRINPKDNYYLHVRDGWVYYFDLAKGEFRPSFPSSEEGRESV